MLKIAIGPEVARPSWNWVGFDLARELSKYFSVEVYRRRIPRCDAVLVIKNMPDQLPRGGRAKVIYFPIDYFRDPASIAAAAPFLRTCAAIVCHARPLMAHFAPYCTRLFAIDHHARYALPTPPPFKERGFVLWVGAFEYVPFLLKWYELHPPHLNLVLLTNVSNLHSQSEAFKLAERLNVRIKTAPMQINGYRTYEWSDRGQRDLMLNAKAAIDIKGGDWLGAGDCWNQRMKPPTKAQQFVSSGIPFACNTDCHAVEYFKDRGFSVAAPTDDARWFSYDYWRETRAQAESLRELLSLKTIGLQVKAIIEQACCGE